MVVRVNGEEWGRGNSSDMHWKFEDCIAHASRSETLHSGEFFGSGTVGNGCGLEQLRFLKPGDVVELEVEGMGCPAQPRGQVKVAIVTGAANPTASATKSRSGC